MMSEQLKQRAIALANKQGVALPVVIEQALEAYLGGQANTTQQTYTQPPGGQDIEALRRAAATAMRESGQVRAKKNDDDEDYDEDEDWEEDEDNPFSRKALKRACDQAQREAGRR